VISAIDQIIRCIQHQPAARDGVFVVCIECGGATPEPYRGLPRCATCALRRQAGEAR
jgi:hypothetical protein